MSAGITLQCGRACRITCARRLSRFSAYTQNLARQSLEHRVQQLARTTGDISDFSSKERRHELQRLLVQLNGTRRRPAQAAGVSDLAEEPSACRTRPWRYHRNPRRRSSTGAQELAEDTRRSLYRACWPQGLHVFGGVSGGGRPPDTSSCSGLQDQWHLR